MQKMFGPVLYEAFRTIKRTFDPDGIFNPGKIVDSPPLTANLRFGAGYVSPTPRTFFDYSEYGGMGGAVEMCSGLGRLPQDAGRHDVPFVHGDAARRRIRRAGAPTCCGSLWRASLGDSGSRRSKAFTKCSICASNAARVKRSVRWAWIWRDSRANFWRVTGKRYGTPLARADARQCSHRCETGQPVRLIVNWVQGMMPVRMLNEAVFGIDHRRTLPRAEPEDLRIAGS